MGQKPGRPVVADAIPSLWRGTVVEIHSNGMVYVLIPRLAANPVGPMPTAVAGLVAGTPVVVAAIEDSRNDLLVLAAAGPPPVTP
jgi:hypothetical protein